MKSAAISRNYVNLHKKPTKIQDPLVLNERIFSLMGVWPMEKSYVKFFMIMSYYYFFILLQFGDLLDAMGNLEEMVANAMESSLLTATILMIHIVRFSKIIVHVIKTVKEEVASDICENDDEIELYYYYNHLSRVFSKYVTFGAAFTGFMIYVSPLLQLLRTYTVEGNIGTEYPLPFRFKSFIDYSNLRNYILVYAYLCLLPYTAFFHINTAALLYNLVLHVCGRLSILSYRIRNISTTDVHRFNTIIKGIVKLHLDIKRTGKSIDDVYNRILLLMLGESSLRLGLSMYTLLTISDDADPEKAITFGTYVVVMTLLLYSLCFIGEQLVHESRNLQDAYYYCNWEGLPYTCRKSLLICMINGQKMLQITAGKFYVFSLYGFTGIMKTSFTYVSMLKTML